MVLDLEIIGSGGVMGRLHAMYSLTLFLRESLDREFRRLRSLQSIKAPLRTGYVCYDKLVYLRG